MKRIITIILLCLPFVAFGQTTDYVDRIIETPEYKIMLDEIIYKEPLEFNTLAEAFSFIGRANRTENVRIIEDKELGIVSYHTLYVVRSVSVYGMIFEARYYNYNRFVRLRYKSENKDDCSRKEVLRAILLKVKEEYAPNSEIKKETDTLDFRGDLYTDTKYYIGGYIITESYSTKSKIRSISIEKEKDAKTEIGLYTR